MSQNLWNCQFRKVYDILFKMFLSCLEVKRKKYIPPFPKGQWDNRRHDKYTFLNKQTLSALL